MTEPPRRAVVADDHPAILRAVADALARAEVDVVAGAPDGRSALRAVTETQPDVAILDYRMPGLGGSELIQQARAASPHTAIIVYTADADYDLVRAALASGTAGLVLKEAPLTDLVRAVDAVLAGSTFVDAAAAALLVQTSPSRTLTQREAEVLRLLIDGLTHDAIGERLDLSGDTVRTHVRKATARLEARNRTHAVATAMRLGLL